MKLVLKFFFFLLALLAAPVGFAETPGFFRPRAEDWNVRNEAIAEPVEPQVKLVAKREDPEIGICEEEGVSEPTDRLPEYFGAVSGGLLALGALGYYHGFLVAYYKLEGMLLVTGIAIGFLCSYSTHLRTKAIFGVSCKVGKWTS